MFKEIHQTKNISRDSNGKELFNNTKEYIVVHHTGGAFAGSFRTLMGETSRQVSAHYLIDQDGAIYKLALDDHITWHAGVSEWEGRTNMNRYSIGIELVSVNGRTYTDYQRKACVKLISTLVESHNIPHNNILRHYHVAPKRKWDVGPEFFQPYGEWERFQLLFAFKPENMDSKYTNILDKEIKKGYEPIFTSHKGNGGLSEQEVKELIEIAVARSQKVTKNTVVDFLRGLIKKKK